MESLERSQKHERGPAWLRLLQLLALSALCSVLVMVADEARGWLWQHCRPLAPLAEDTIEEASIHQPKRRLAAPSLVVQSAQKPFYNFVYLVFTGDTEAAVERRDLLRRLYGDYGGWSTATDAATGNQKNYSLIVLFVARREGAPPEGIVEDDMFYVDVRDGYGRIAEKTRRMLSVVHHMDFDFLMKGDDDTFVCFNVLATILHALPEDTRGRIYGGVPTTCGISPDHPKTGSVIMIKRHKWYDPLWAEHTHGALACYPVYMQGAFYVLSQPLVAHLERGREHLVVFGNEDVSMGSWLLGTDRELLRLGDIADSQRHPPCPICRRCCVLLAPVVIHPTTCR